MAIASVLLIAGVAARMITHGDNRPSIPHSATPADVGSVTCEIGDPLCQWAGAAPTDVVVNGNDSTLALQAAIDAGDLARFKAAIRRLGVYGVTCHADGIAVACSAADSRFAAGWTFADPRSG